MKKTKRINIEIQDVDGNYSEYTGEIDGESGGKIELTHDPVQVETPVVLQTPPTPAQLAERSEEQFERDNKATVIKWKEFVNGWPVLSDWLSKFQRFTGIPSKTFIVFRHNTEKGSRISIKFYTKLNEYTLAVRRPILSEDCRDAGYLGLQVSTRAPRAGSKWAGGRDLADGSFSYGTWWKILEDIVAWELTQIGEH